jgi:hypothetical protein
MHEFCEIIEREEIRIVGVRVRFDAESRGIPHEFGTNTCRAAAQKFAGNGILASLCEIFTGEREIIGARTGIIGDGVFDFVFGVALSKGETIPSALPENTIELEIPAHTYMRMAINERKLPDRKGVSEQMIADEYFIQGFREDTKYVFDKTGTSFNTYDKSGEFIYKYEPIKIPQSDTEKLDTFVCTPVVLPEIKVACSVSGPNDEFVIFKYFGVQDKIFPLQIAKNYNDDYYGFPINRVEEQLVSAFGSRVSSFDGLPDCVEGHIIPGGLYLHIWQHEPNGDNPSMCYDAGFNHINELFFDTHTEYARDNTRHVIARFRQANHASVFVPLTKK